MDKRIILLPLLFVFQIVTAQEVKFSNGEYDNGLIYPIAEFHGNAATEDMLNKNILKIVSGYQEKDYCIGQYGFVQQTSFIQLNFYFNCIDMDESTTESHLFSLEDGEPCAPSEMFIEKRKKGYLPYFKQRVSRHFIEFEKEEPSKEFLKSLSIDDCQVTLLEEGIKISIPNADNWPDEDLLLFWSELRPYLKTTFI